MERTQKVVGAMDGKKPAASVPDEPSESDESKAKDWRQSIVPPLDTPEIRKRVGTIIGEHATGKRKSRAHDGQ